MHYLKNSQRPPKIWNKQIYYMTFWPPTSVFFVFSGLLVRGIRLTIIVVLSKLCTLISICIKHKSIITDFFYSLGLQAQNLAKYTSTLTSGWSFSENRIWIPPQISPRVKVSNYVHLLKDLAIQNFLPVVNISPLCRLSFHFV